MKVVITHHAIERFMARVAGAEQDPARAREQLLRLSEVATPLKTRTILGTPIWRVDHPACLLIVKPDSETRGHVVVTVMRDTYSGRDPRDYGSLDAVALAIDPDPSRAAPAKVVPRPDRDYTVPPSPKSKCRCAEALEETRAIAAAQTEMARASILRDQEKTRRHAIDSDVEALREAFRASVPYLVTMASRGDVMATACLGRLEAIDAEVVVKALRDAWRAA